MRRYIISALYSPYRVVCMSYASLSALALVQREMTLVRYDNLFLRQALSLL